MGETGASTISSVHPATPAHDQLDRPLRDLRLSVTDRCNFRCTYCMPKEVFGADYQFLPKSEILSFEEIARVARLFVEAGVEKIRITGGEPLLRRELSVLIRMLAGINGLRDLTLTTNGAALATHAVALRDYGLRRLTVSLDGLNDATFSMMNGIDFPVAKVIDGIDAALAAGFCPVKINMVVRRGVNEQEIIPMAKRFHGPEFILRFIEYMDVGNTNGWRLDDVVPASEIIDVLSEEFSLEAIQPNYPGETARRYLHRNGGGEIGIIASVTQPFCRGCTRARISSDGRFYTCLFGESACDFRAAMRSGADDSAIAEMIRSVWRSRNDRYSEIRSAAHLERHKPEMSLIGG